MKIIFTGLLAIGVCFILKAQNNMHVADSNNVFAFKLYNEVNKNAKESLFFSPFSISTALAMTYAGARNETEIQMCNTMHFSLDQNNFHREYKNYLEKVESDTGKDLVLGIANSLWIANTLKLSTPFTEIVTDDYNSEANNVSFSNPEQIRQEINSWVESKTNNKIKDLIGPNVLNPNTRLVLVNAIYFKGKWECRFANDSTRKEEFYKSSSTSIKADFMHNTTHYKYYEDDNLQAIELPYSGGKTSMILFLPKRKDGINDMESKLNYSYSSKIASSLVSQKNVILAIPRFKTTVEFELSNTLSTMGMPNAFINADFSRISNENITISKVIHKAFIDVNEEGTEAAAATAIVMTTNAIFPHPKTPVFVANHPFIFVIRDDTTGGILFMGKITDPTKE